MGLELALDSMEGGGVLECSLHCFLQQHVDSYLCT